MDQYSSDNELILKYIKELRLPTVKDSMDDIVSEAQAAMWDYRKFLRVLLQREVEQRIENRKFTRIKRANFPQMKHLQEYNGSQKLDTELRQNKTLNFVVRYGKDNTKKVHA